MLRLIRLKLWHNSLQAWRLTAKFWIVLLRCRQPKQLTGEIDDGRAGITAGGAIYINAASINVNGKIQSGYEDYKLNLNQQKAQELISKGNTLGQDNLPHAQFKTEEYLVTTGRKRVYYDNATGKFVYGVKAWYNPTTGQIFTEDIEQAGGGRIYLTGAIASTNKGRRQADCAGRWFQLLY